MSKEAAARIQSFEDDVAPTKPPTADEVLVHVRFYPNTEISSIGEKPNHLSAGERFERLLQGASPHYQTFAGGRGFFRIPRAAFEAISKGPAG